MGRKLESTTSPLQVGTRFLKYEIFGVLGKGGQGYVYEALDPFLERRVAIKIIPHPRQPERARQEARALLRLNHGNIVQLIDGGLAADGAFYLIMERLNGASLRAVLRRYKRLTVSEALLIAEQATQALDAAHQAKVIHRDIKPENIFIQPDNQLKILDFGIAKLVDASSLITAQQATPGTLSYMSPEQLDGTVTERSDLYALGTTLYEMLAGVHPCVIGTHDLTQQALLGIQLLRDPPRLDQVAPHVPSDLADLIHQLLEKQAAQRPASALDVLRVIEDCRGGFEKQRGAHGPSTAVRDSWVTQPSGDSLEAALSDDLTDIEKRSSFLHADSATGLSSDAANHEASASLHPSHSGTFSESWPPSRSPGKQPSRARCLLVTGATVGAALAGTCGLLWSNRSQVTTSASVAGVEKRLKTLAAANGSLSHARSAHDRAPSESPLAVASSMAEVSTTLVDRPTVATVASVAQQLRTPRRPPLSTAHATSDVQRRTKPETAEPVASVRPESLLSERK